MIDTKDILYKYFELHENPSSIARELNVVPSYVTKVVQKDDRYNEEKEYRLNLSKEKRKKDKRNWIRNKRQNDANMVDDKRTILLKDKTKNKSSYRSFIKRRLNVIENYVVIVILLNIRIIFVLMRLAKYSVQSILLITFLYY